MVFGRFNWDVRFDLAYLNGKVDVYLNIGLVGYVSLRTMHQWVKGSAWWDNKAMLIDSSQAHIPIDYHITFDPLQPIHQTVTVLKGSGPSNMLFWFAKSYNNSGVAAHEEGHMLMLPDEYANGATLHIHHNTLMSDDNTNHFFARYFEPIRDLTSTLAGEPFDLLMLHQAHTNHMEVNL